MFVLAYSNQENNSKTYNVKKYYLSRVITSLSIRKFFEQPIDSYVKPCKDIRKLTTDQGEDSGFLLD